MRLISYFLLGPKLNVSFKQDRDVVMVPSRDIVSSTDGTLRFGEMSQSDAEFGGQSAIKYEAIFQKLSITPQIPTVDVQSELLQ